MKHFSFFMPLVWNIMLCATFGQQSSENPQTRLPLNFKGTLEDIQGNIFTVDNISLSGNYQNIPFYTQPTKEDLSPTAHTTFIDLKNITSLEPVRKNEEPVFEHYQNHTYQLVNVILNNDEHTQHHYLLDAHKKITCELQEGSHALRKELALEAVKKLTITSFEQQETISAAKQAEEATLKEKQCAKAGQVIHELQTAVNKVSDKTLRARLSEMVETVRDWLGGICR